MEKLISAKAPFQFKKIYLPVGFSSLQGGFDALTLPSIATMSSGLKSIQDALDFMWTHGMVKLNHQGQLTHVPLALHPCPIPPETYQQMVSLTPHFNQLQLSISRNRDFLEHHLEPIARVDDFMERLLQIKTATITQPLQLMINRNDYFLTNSISGFSRGTQPKQVEINMIAASFPFLSTQTTKLHRFWWDGTPLGQKICPNKPLRQVVQAMAQAIQLYDHPHSCLAMIIQKNEHNVFDQRGIEFELLRTFGIPTLRLTLEDIAERASLQNGHLKIGESVLALTYFRAAYTPDEFKSHQALQGRQLIEASSSIKVPDINLQLSGMKKIQQVLTNRQQLSQFVPDAVAERLLPCFVGIYELDQLVESTDGLKTALDWAYSDPEHFVLKPQREGGGNNIYGKDIVPFLKALPAQYYSAYILMERIDGITHSATLLVEKQATTSLCLSEIGSYGICLAQGEELLLNEDAGYLVRTKVADQNEGGVCAGYACLNALCLQNEEVSGV